MEDGDEGTFLTLGIRKIPGGYALKGRKSLVEDVQCKLSLRRPIRRVCRRPSQRISRRVTTSRSERWSVALIFDAWAVSCNWRHIVQTFNVVLGS